MLAIHAEDLIICWITMLHEPAIPSFAASGLTLLSQLVSVIVDVIDAEKQWLSFAATCTNATSELEIDSRLDSKPASNRLRRHFLIEQPLFFRRHVCDPSPLRCPRCCPHMIAV